MSNNNTSSAAATPPPPPLQLLMVMMLHQLHWPPPAGRRCSCSWSSWRWRRRWWGSSSPPEPPARTLTPKHTLAWCSFKIRDTPGQSHKSPGLTEQLHTKDTGNQAKQQPPVMAIMIITEPNNNECEDLGLKVHKSKNKIIPPALFAHSHSPVKRNER